MLPYVLHHISEYHYKRRPDATRASFTMTAAWCLYTSCVHACNLSHHSTLLWGLLDAFTEIDHKVTRNVISMQSAATQHYLLLAPQSLDQVNFNLTHVVTLVFHLYTIIYEQVFCQFVQPIVGNTYVLHQYCPRLNLSIPSTTSSSFYTSSLPWLYF
jgi:hypothetical protein